MGRFTLPTISTKRLVGTHDNHIALLQTDIVIHLALHDELIDVQMLYRLSVTNQTDVTQATDIIHTTGTVQGMENRRKSRKCISTGTVTSPII